MTEQADGSTHFEQRQFGGFKRDRRELAEWVALLRPEEVVMQSTGIYSEESLRGAGSGGGRVKVVNARHVKSVSELKTGVGDAHWLVMLPHAGLLQGPFVPPATVREMRRIARQCQKLV